MAFSRATGLGVRELFVEVLGTRRGREIGYGPPPGFEAYARILHPMDPGDGSVAPSMRWAEVAEAFRRPLTPLTTWDDLIDGVEQDGSAFWDPGPMQGGLPREQARALAEALAMHVDVQDCLFGLWIGYGDIDDRFRHFEMLDVAARDTCLIEGDLADAATNVLEPGWFSAHFHRTVNVWLPPDASWLVTTELYATNTIVAGRAELIAAIEAVPELEVLRIEPGDVQAMI